MDTNEHQDKNQITPEQGDKNVLLLNKMLKEDMPFFMTLMETTDTKGAPIISLCGESLMNVKVKFETMKKALMNPKYREQTVDEILTDLVVAAYRDRLVLTTVVPTAKNEGDVAILRSVQKMRHLADNHLLNILRAYRDIKRPPVKVVVKQADQVNIGEQINQGQQQVNIAKNEQLTK